MKFSAVNVMEKERARVENKRREKNIAIRIIDYLLTTKDPYYTFTFYVDTYTFMRSKPLCEDLAEGNEIITPGDLAAILFEDFIAYTKQTNNPHALFKNMQARDLSPIEVNKSDGESEFIYEEYRGFEKVNVQIRHSMALRGEFLLRDMLDLYPSHTYSLENILEVVFRDFINDYRHGLIKDPVSKIERYL